MSFRSAPRVLRASLVVAAAVASLAPLAPAKSNLYSNPLLPAIAAEGVVEAAPTRR